jgi:thiol-disulfide isomerase/thioredoxin
MERNSRSIWKLRFAALGFGVLALIVVYGITQVYSNDVRLMYWSGATLLFWVAVWLGRRKEDWLAALILVLPSLIAFSCLVLVEVSFLWPHLLLWLATVAIGLVFLKLVRRRRGLAIGLVAALVVSSVGYCEFYIPRKLAHEFNRFADSSAPAFTLIPVSDGAVPLSPTPGKILVIDFFSTSCAPCIEELPELSAVRAELQRNHDIQFVIAASELGNDTPAVFEHSSRGDTSIFHSRSMPAGKCTTALDCTACLRSWFSTGKAGSV